MSPGDALISVTDLHKTYGKSPWKKGFRALNGITLDVGRGSVFGLLGPNGAGKTTLIKVLLGLVPRFEGKATLFGEPLGTASVRQRVGYLPEAHRMPPYLTGRQTLYLLGMYAGRSRKWLNSRVPGWLERVGMSKSADRKLREYSKGMQQRIGLVQALIHEPELVFLDEPTDGVDPVGRKVVREIIEELRQKGVTIFINSHLLLEVEKMCDRVVIMSAGRMIREGTVDELTPRTGKVRFEVDPSPEDLGAQIGELGSNYAPVERGFEMELSREQQDAVIDRLRKLGISVRSIEASKLTLEQSFIDLIQGKQS